MADETEKNYELLVSKTELARKDDLMQLHALTWNQIVLKNVNLE